MRYGDATVAPAQVTHRQTVRGHHVTYSYHLRIILIIAGGAAYAVTEFASWTTIPAFLGLALTACALVGMIHRSRWRKVWRLHLGRRNRGERYWPVCCFQDIARPAAVITSTIGFIFLALYAALIIRSMVITAREQRNPAKFA